MQFKAQFQMYYFVNSHLSYSLLRNSKIHFLSLSSHFGKIWSIVQDGAPAHAAGKTIEYLQSVVGNRIISHALRKDQGNQIVN